jgi:hypothetical protein
MRLPSCFRRSSSAPEAAGLGLAGSMTNSARVCLVSHALHFARMSCLFTLALEGQKLPVVTKMTLALDRFHHLSQYGIAVCKQCLCAVWSAQYKAENEASDAQPYPVLSFLQQLPFIFVKHSDVTII